MLTTDTAAADVAALRETIEGELVQPGDEAWDAARQAWNLAVDQRPALVVFPAGADDVKAAVAFAAANGLPVAVQGTGHGAAARGSIEGALLVNMARLDAFEIDPEARTVRVGPGTLWGPVCDAAGEHGLAGLAGSSRDVGVVGYTLGGGTGWLARKHGLASGSVRAIEIVTADGEHRRVDDASDPELFWALRGGGGSFGVVTGMELELFPVSEVYAGSLFWPVEKAREIFSAYAAWADAVPDEVTSVVRILHLPPLPMIPEAIRGRSWVAVEAAYLGGEADGAALLQPLRELEPALDTFASMPAPALGQVHGDPEGPVPSAGDHALLAELGPDTVETIVEHVGAGSDTALLSFELRQLGGALSRQAPGSGALASLDGAYAMFAVGMAMGPEQAAASAQQSAAVAAALAPWSTGKHYLNFKDRPGDASKAFGAGTYARLRDVKSAYDPESLFLSNHPVETAG